MGCSSRAYNMPSLSVLLKSPRNRDAPSRELAIDMALLQEEPLQSNLAYADSPRPELDDLEPTLPISLQRWAANAGETSGAVGEWAQSSSQESRIDGGSKNQSSPADQKNQRSKVALRMRPSTISASSQGTLSASSINFHSASPSVLSSPAGTAGTRSVCFEPRDSWKSASDASSVRRSTSFESQMLLGKYADITNSGAAECWRKHGPRDDVSINGGLKRRLSKVSQKSNRTIKSGGTEGRGMKSLYAPAEDKTETDKELVRVSSLGLPRMFKPMWAHDRHTFREGLRKRLRAAMESIAFQSFVVLVILTDLTLAVLALAKNVTTPIGAEIAILRVLCFDIGLRMLAEASEFWRGPSRWLNVFELLVVIVCVTIFVIESETEAPTPALRLMGRLVRLSRPLVFACQQRTRFVKTAQRTAHAKVFKLFDRLLKDIIKVRTDSVHVDPVDGDFLIFCAEVRTETFEQLFLPITVTGGFFRELRVVLPLLDTPLLNASEHKIKVQLHNFLLLLGPCMKLDEDQRDFAYQRESRTRLVELISKRLEIFQPILAPLMGINKSKTAELGKSGRKSTRNNLQQDPASPGKDMSRGKFKDVRVQAYKERLKARLIRCLLGSLDIEIKRFEVRYEDICDLQPEPFACGLKFGHLAFKAARIKEKEGGSSEKEKDGGSSTSGHLSDDSDTDPDPPQSPRKSLVASPVAANPGGSQSFFNASSSPNRSWVPFLRQSWEPVMEEAITFQQLTIERLCTYWDVQPSTSYNARYRKSPAELYKHFVVSGRWELVKLRVVGDIAKKCCESENSHKWQMLQGPMFRERFDHHYYTLFPLDVHAKAWRRHEAPWREPPRTVKVSISPLDTVIDNRQMHGFNQMLMHWRLWAVENETLNTRPLRTIIEGPPSYIAKERWKDVEDDERIDHIRCWWRHAVRASQIRLSLKPRLISEDFKQTIVDELQGEYVNLLVQHKFARHLSTGTRDDMIQRIMDLQVLLPLGVIMKARVVARSELKELKAANKQVKTRRKWYCLWKKKRQGFEEDLDLGFVALQACEREQDQYSEDGSTSVSANFLIPRKRKARFHGDQVVNLEEVSWQVEQTEDHRKYPEWDHTIEIDVQIETVQCYIMAQSMWSSLVSAIHQASTLSSHKIQVQPSFQPGRIGGFGFERFGVRLPPRNLFCSACLEYLAFDASLPPDLFKGRGGSIGHLDCAIESLSVVYCDGYQGGELVFRTILDMDRTSGFDRNFATAYLEGQHMSSASRRPSTGSRSSDDSFTTLFTTFEAAKNPVQLFVSASWVGEVAVAPIKFFHYKPMFEKLQAMMYFGRRAETARLTEVEQEFLSMTQTIAQAPLRRRHEKLWRRLLRMIQVKAKGRMLLDCSFGSVQLEYCSRYSKEKLCLASSALPACNGRMVWTGADPFFTWRLDADDKGTDATRNGEPVDRVNTAVQEAKSLVQELVSIWPSSDRASTVELAARTKDAFVLPQVSTELCPGESLTMRESSRSVFCGKRVCDTECCAQRAQSWGQMLSCGPPCSSAPAGIRVELSRGETCVAEPSVPVQIGVSRLPSLQEVDESWAESEEPAPEPACREESHSSRPSSDVVNAITPKGKKQISLDNQIDDSPIKMSSGWTLHSEDAPKKISSAFISNNTNGSGLASGLLRHSTTMSGTEVASNDALGLWRALPWEVTVRLVSPSLVGLNVGNAAIRGEDFFFLDTFRRTERKVKRADQTAYDVLIEGSKLEEVAQDSWRASFRAVEQDIASKFTREHYMESPYGSSHSVVTSGSDTVRHSRSSKPSMTGLLQKLVGSFNSTSASPGQRRNSPPSPRFSSSPVV